MFYIILILLLLQVKHWYIDFVNQSMEEVNHKGIYGNWVGMKHSVKHGMATTLILLPFLIDSPGIAVILGVADFVTHYHIDWAKMNWGNRDINNPLFWNHLGLDQMMHQVVYILIIGSLTL